jgi:hypothetical protein
LLTPEQINEIAKIVPTEKVYNDLLSPTFREIGDLAKNTVKAARFIAAPIDYLAAKQDRWQLWLKKISDKVPEQNLIEAHPLLSGPAIEGLQYLEEDSLLAEMFLNLLARAIDKERVNEAHPAFAKIISQLSPDEAQILIALKGNNYEIEQISKYDQAKNLFFQKETTNNTYPLNTLLYPQHFFLYMDHLHSLNLAGIWQKGNQEPVHSNNIQIASKIRSEARLTLFGELFAKACISDDLSRPKSE